MDGEEGCEGNGAREDVKEKYIGKEKGVEGERQ